MSKIQHKGLHANRLLDQPRNYEEKRFAEAWKDFAPSNLKYLLSQDQNFPLDPTERDCQVAATTIQWLGTEVGQRFLRELGYERR